MYDDILGPIEEKIEVKKTKINLVKGDTQKTAPKAKLGAAPKAKLSVTAPAPTNPIPVPAPEADDLCDDCGEAVDECECPPTFQEESDEDEDDPWSGVDEEEDCEGCSGCDDI